jgi:pimeloyl-ACP methyl ester carboxylesterase
MKTSILNRNGLLLTVLIEGDPNSKNLAFIIHGLSGSKDQPHIIQLRETFINSGFTTISFDTAFSFGESEGDSIHATATSYLHDLEDVIEWASNEPWHKEHFFIGGHSLGGLSSILYTADHGKKVKGLFPLASAVSGALSTVSKDPNFIREWKNRGYFEKVSKSLPGKQGKIGWGLKEDLDTYDALQVAGSIRCPAILIVGENDSSTPPSTQMELNTALSGQTELHVIPGMGHNPTSKHELDQMKNLMERWIATVISSDD